MGFPTCIKFQREKAPALVSLPSFVLLTAWQRAKAVPTSPLPLISLEIDPSQIVIENCAKRDF